ncbi:MAG: hypothetical protein WAP35_08995 [Solirubrobacterales bacterium]
MSRAEVMIEAPIERVFAVLSNPRSYAHWVIGSDRIREADQSWSAVGSEFKHVVGFSALARRVQR